MRSIKILDCTLRDGGCVNNFNFGSLYMSQILSGIEKSGIEIVELGYIDSQKGSASERTQYSNEQVITENFLKHKKAGVTYLAMTDYGKFHPDLLEPKTETSIDGIRLAFHKKNRKDIIEWGRKILEKGYQLFVQPMTCLRYSDAEMLDLIQDVNTYLQEATAFYIVDSFGEMRLDDLNRIAHLVNHNLADGIAMGLHSHNNLQLSYSNAVTLLNFPMKRDLIFDASIMGMGKGAGNMTTELFAEHLNLYQDKHYQIAPLLEVIDTTINQIRANYKWGYAVEYYLSAANHCTPSYAGHFYNKHMLSIEQVAELLQMIAEEKKISFDKDYADELYYSYNAHRFNDAGTLLDLEKELGGKDILLIAPGASVLSNIDKISEAANRKDTIVVALNNIPPIKTDYIFTSKKATYEQALTSNRAVLVTSNVTTSPQNGKVINYNSWTVWSGGKSDNAMIVIMNILRKIGAKKVLLAGFDGFSSDVDKNYYDDRLKRPVTKEQAEQRNIQAKAYVNEMRKSIKIVFLTRSVYE